MPKVTLEFNLPEEQEEFETTTNASKFRAVLWELDQSFYRANIKYGLQHEIRNAVILELKDAVIPANVSNEDLDDIILSVLQVCRDKLHEELSDNEVSIG